MREASALLSAATFNNQTTAFGGHACTETVGTLLL